MPTSRPSAAGTTRTAFAATPRAPHASPEARTDKPPPPPPGFLRPGERPPAADDRAAQPGGDGDVHKIAAAACGAGDRLADGGHDGVTVQVDRTALEPP